jgi:small subunit ribosomal protein S2
MTAKISMRDLLEAGVHFGHQTRRWNPKMEQYIYGARDGVHIINLGKTLRLFNDATHFVSRVVSRGDQLLFVGTKRQAQSVIEDEATRCNMPFVTHRWLGGMLTNHQTIQKSLERLDSIERSLAEGSVERLSKKEILSFEKERNKLLRNLGGVRNMPKLPGAVFVIDPNRERIAIKEAKRLNIPVIAVCDTNCDPDDATYPIPGNDDAIRAIRLFATAMSNACMAGKDVTKDLVGDFESTFSSEKGEDDAAEGMKKTDTEVEVVRRQRGGKKTADEAAADAENAGPEAEVSTDAEAEVSTEAVDEVAQEEASPEAEEAPTATDAEATESPAMEAAATEEVSEEDVTTGEKTDEA